MEQPSPTPCDRARETQGLWYGMLGVVAFSLTLPASHMAVRAFGSILVGPGRALVAGALSLIALRLRRAPWPRKRHLKGLLIVAGGAVLAFPLLSAWAMDRLPATHGAVELALLPLATAAISAWLHRARPAWCFWASSAAAAATVVAYAIVSGFGHIQPPDIALLAAIILVAFAYAEGGQLAQDLGGWQVIAWAILLSVPVVTGLVLISVLRDPAALARAGWPAWMALIYLGIGSQFLGFVAWYTGLAMGGVARVSQAQYLQPFFTLIFSWLLLGERLTVATVAAALLVVIWVGVGKRAPIYPPSHPTGKTADGRDEKSIHQKTR